MSAQLLNQLKKERDKYSSLVNKYKAALTRVLDGPWQVEPDNSDLKPWDTPQQTSPLTPKAELEEIREFVQKILSE